ncbi:helicase-related protein [Coraliomargarita sp. SDUM461004]|uniref:Helicase-related protein n=1 Tax=Thalassobacterium sedimentorum TaxID=3041258 RepID=A0ABU1AKQ4_9BACT|nr:helicase-related protein [Coraliomargarita sp. SDUM461004]MDQ8195329.1 helicase-related protein [Coraliomargarita sp. SDUM461004]
MCHRVQRPTILCSNYGRIRLTLGRYIPRWGSRHDSILWKVFKQGQFPVLTATDLLARGINIDCLSLVIKYELPRSPKGYLHRIGRTGRVEASGEAITLITPEKEHHFQVIQKKMGQRVPMITSDEIDLSGC